MDIGQKLAHFPESLEASHVRRFMKGEFFFPSYPIKMIHELSQPWDGEEGEASWVLNGYFGIYRDSVNSSPGRPVTAQPGNNQRGQSLSGHTTVYQMLPCDEDGYERSHQARP